jgi:hypothetical protein
MKLLSLNILSFNMLSAALILPTPLLAVAVSSASAQIREASLPTVEEIYVARSVRESRITPTEFCAKTKTGVSDATSEDQYSFRSVATRTSDGRVIDRNVSPVGSVHACFGRTPDPAIVQFYGDIVFDSIALKGLGECRLGKSDFPEQGVYAFRCFLDLSSMSGEYVGGLLTTSSMFSQRPIGTETDPVGYTQSSIATIRLWKKRDGR